jgi:hypothetical protein
LYNILNSDEAEEMNKQFNKNTIIASKNSAKRYFYNKEHALIVEKAALAIFDKLQKIHGDGRT